MPIDPDVIKAIVGAITTGSAYLLGKFRSKVTLKEIDFTLEKDRTLIEISKHPPAASDLVVIVERSFEMKAKKKGRYRFARTLEATKGKWDKYNLKHRGQTVAIKPTDNDSKIRAIKLLRFSQGELLDGELRSHEVIRRDRGFYLLVINAEKGQTSVKVSVRPNAELQLQKIKCYALSEDLDKIDIGHNGQDFATIPGSNTGITYLVEW